MVEKKIGDRRARFKLANFRSSFKLLRLIKFSDTGIGLGSEEIWTLSLFGSCSSIGLAKAGEKIGKLAKFEFDFVCLFGHWNRDSPKRMQARKQNNVKKILLFILLGIVKWSSFAEKLFACCQGESAGVDWLVSTLGFTASTEDRCEHQM